MIYYIMIEPLDNEIKKYNSLLSSIDKYKNSKNYDRIIKLDTYNQIILNKLFLYEPTDYDGWTNFINYFATRHYLGHLKILIDADVYGVIELIKYIRESNDQFYVMEHVSNKMSGKSFEYLKKSFGISVIKNIMEKYDIIFTNNIENMINHISSTGEIIMISNIKNIQLPLGKSIICRSSKFINDDGNYLMIYRNGIDKNENYHNVFLNNHLHKINMMLTNKLDIFNISNLDLQNKIISKYQNKLMSQIINRLISLNIPVKTKIIKYYDNKLIEITNKLYSSVNLLGYRFITYDDVPLEYIQSDNVLYNNLHNISTNLNKIKRAIDTRYFKRWQYITYQLDNYKSLGEYITKNYNVINNKNEKVSNAFMKMYEMLMSYNLIPKDKTSLKSFHFCEAPGMFIVGLNHYIQTKTSIKDWLWFGNSLTIEADKTALVDIYGIIGKNKEKWLIGSENSGDIRDLSNIKYFKEKLGEVDLITSDCGINVDVSQLNKYEELISETDYAQFINLLNLLSKGGSGLIKTFIPLELASNVCIIYTLTQLFSEVYLSKPITSRPQNSEVYIVCIDYHGIDKDLLNVLTKRLDKKLYPKYNPHQKWIKNIPESFMQQLEDYIVDITRQQISYLLNIFHFVDNSDEFNKIQLLKDDKLKEKTNHYWCDKFAFESNNTTNKLL